MSRLVDENGCIEPVTSPREQEQLARLANYQRPPIEMMKVDPVLHENYRRVLKEAERIWLDRQVAYGLTDFDIGDILVLCKMKVSRLMKGEVTEDSLLDLANYAAIGLMVTRGEWCE